MIATVFYPSKRVRCQIFGISSAEELSFVGSCFQNGEYSSVFRYETDLEGEAAAEELFDLTNNPDRDDERTEKCGTIRSLSVGDIVELNNERWVCQSIGWGRI